jgi:hypothetical protein
MRGIQGEGVVDENGSRGKINYFMRADEVNPNGRRFNHRPSRSQFDSDLLMQR